ncbi:PREDICTED: leukocyte surface antigen CD53-like, partial [Nicrophorus vespilloides]|uniref:Tetraspanin n=1 Tax=Nicrophorus vespilloides TaxID=110193 RepID=A0ABM1M305_NICVS
HTCARTPTAHNIRTYFFSRPLFLSFLFLSRVSEKPVGSPGVRIYLIGTMCYRFAKYFLVILNFLFWLLGLAIVALALWMLLDPTFYISMAQDPNNYYIGTYILLTVGALLVIVSFLGCCGSCKESQCMLVSFFSILLVVLVAQIATLVWGYINAESLEPLVQSTMKHTVQSEYADVDSRRMAFDTIQKGLQCCGAERPSDWIGSKPVVVGISADPLFYSIPESCCREGIDVQVCRDATKVLKAGGEINTRVIYGEGCIDKVVQVIKTNAITFIIVGVTVIAVEVVGLLFSLILLVSISRSVRYKG